MSTSNHVIEGLLRGDHRVIARAISSVENETPNSTMILRALFSHTGRAYRVGVTGPPGAGKSTLTNKLAKYYRRKRLKIGVIAVDPTSPFTGGALLGDRVRMTDVELDDSVFIRSMASRGSQGGLSKKAREAADVLDAAGFDIILMETVGVGQSELDIAGAADTTIVVLVPESGDGIQAMKAGLMEIADFFVLNKSDRPGADQAIASLQSILMMKEHDENSWLPKIIKTIASENKGITEIADEIQNHHNYLNEHSLFIEKREKRTKIRIKEIVENKIREDLWSESGEKSLNLSLEKVVLGDLSPYNIAEEIIENFIKQKK